MMCPNVETLQERPVPGAADKPEEKGTPEVFDLVRRAGPALGLEAGKIRVEPLAGDGSDRKFYRVRQGSLRFVALVSPRKASCGLDENDSYHRIGRHLRERGVPVPAMPWADPLRGEFLLEDLGDCHLQRMALRRPAGIETLYREALRLLLNVHENGSRGFDPGYCFDTPVYEPRFVYERELEYFRKAFLVGCLGLDADAEDLRHDFEALAERAGVCESAWVIHRDFQSRNIMVCGGRLRLVDFQGMRLGPPAYDLASLLADPYVALPRRLQERLEELYRRAAERALGISPRAFSESYVSVRLCRNLQMLGAFGFLGVKRGKRQFLAYIPRALRQLGEWLDGRCCGRYPELEKWVGAALRRASVTPWSLP
ncbi:MAG: phosphotransferase [Syntrophobacteraceae bacterium]